MDNLKGEGRCLRVALDVTTIAAGQRDHARVVHGVLDELASNNEIDLSWFVTGLRARRTVASLVPEGIAPQPRPILGALAALVWSRTDLFGAERLLGEVDVVHGFGALVPPTRSAARVLTVTDAPGGSDDGRFESLWPQNRQLLRLVRHGGTLHVPTWAVADQIRADLKVGGDQVAVIPIGVTPPGPADDAQASSVIDPGRPFVLAEIDTWSVHEQLDAIAAFEELASGQTEIHLVMLGAGDDAGGEVATTLAASAWSSRIIRVASVGEQGRRALLGRARVVLHLAERDGLGFPVLDAMAAGTPVVAVRSAPMREVAEGAVLLAEAGDRDAIAVALNLAVTDEATRSVLVTAGQVRAAGHSWSQAAGSLLDLYRRLAAP